MPERERKAFISTSAIDLPEHREQAAEACRQMGWRPLMQGQGSAEDPELLPTRLNAIDGCELFIGICGFRYGYVPQGHKLSIGELEYERAKARGIPCLVYFADDTHARLEEPVRSGMEDAKLERFKKRVASEQSVTLFANAQDLYERVLRALAALREDGAGPQIVSPGTGGVRIEGLQPSVLQGRAPNIQPRRILLPDIDWVEIPAGQFVYQKGERRTLPRFFVARYPVTNIQYQTFIAAGGYADERWWKDLVKPEPQPSRWPQPNRPKTNVDWYEATAFCRWLSVQFGYEIRLPTELEWEKAARGQNGRIWPWGDEFRSGHANINETWVPKGPWNLGQTTAVGVFPQDASEFGVVDVAGNVVEWSTNKHETPEFALLDRPAIRPALCGGSWGNLPVDQRPVNRLRSVPAGRNDLAGFRLFSSAPIF